MDEDSTLRRKRERRKERKKKRKKEPGCGPIGPAGLI
jgi:hypothetical protein